MGESLLRRVDYLGEFFAWLGGALLMKGWVVNWARGLFEWFVCLVEWGSCLIGWVDNWAHGFFGWVVCLVG